jgi:hypothetical protein
MKDNRANPSKKEYWVHKLRTEVNTVPTGGNDLKITNFCEDITEAIEKNASSAIMDEQSEVIGRINAVYNAVNNVSEKGIYVMVIMGAMVGIIVGTVVALVILTIHG